MSRLPPCATGRRPPWPLGVDDDRHNGFIDRANARQLSHDKVIVADAAADGVQLPFLGGHSLWVVADPYTIARLLAGGEGVLFELWQRSNVEGHGLRRENAHRLDQILVEVIEQAWHACCEARQQRSDQLSNGHRPAWPLLLDAAGVVRIRELEVGVVHTPRVALVRGVVCVGQIGADSLGQPHLKRAASMIVKACSTCRRRSTWGRAVLEEGSVDRCPPYPTWGGGTDCARPLPSAASAGSRRGR